MSRSKRIFAISCQPNPTLHENFCHEIVNRHISRLGRTIHHDLKNKWTNAVTWLISALYEAHQSGMDAVVLPRGKKHFSGIEFGHNATMTAHDILESQGFIRSKISPSGITIQLASEIYPTERLKWHFYRTPPVYTPPNYKPMHDVVILREKGFLDEKLEIEIPESPMLEKMRAEIHEINTITSQFMIYPRLPDPILKKVQRAKKRQPRKGEHVGSQLVNLSRTTYRRIFSLGDLNLTKGGRLYWPWWQGLSKRHRPTIRINDEPTVELDIVANYLSLLYAQLGQEIPPDPYNLGIPRNHIKEKRRLTKEFILARFSSLRPYGLDKEKLKILGVSQKELRKLANDKHPLLLSNGFFESTVSFDLMFLDSKIAIDVMLSLLRQDIPVLGVHDSFICLERHEHLLHDAMMEMFKHHAGAYPSIKRTSKKPNFHSSEYRLYETYIAGYKTPPQPGPPV